MKKIIGNTAGLKSTQIKQLENLYLYRTDPEYLISEEQTRELVAISHDIGRQVGLLIDRAGKTIYVIAGDAHRIVIPDTTDYRALPGQLKGLRCIHTHLKDEPLSRDDLTDLALLRLDFMAAVTVTDRGEPGKIYRGHILPREEGLPYEVMAPIFSHELDMDCIEMIKALESELSRLNALYSADKGKEKALLIHVTTGAPKEAKASLAELKELCRSSGVQVIDTAIQRRRKVDPKFVVGKGKLADLTIQAIQKHATMLVFDRELGAAQIRSITDFVEMKVLDRTQIILDIFAKHARSREGKLQVELAQMQYLLPRLITKNTAMSRLTGGIGGRGPGETKLELNRRRVRERIAKLNKDLSKIRKQRSQQRARRNRKGVPVISIVGYTNAGKSTLLNSLTQSNITAANKLFATLDPSSRRLRFPRDVEVIITDTVGFIQDLPDELMDAFQATLEELEQADILLHVVDVSNPRYNQQIQSVEKILKKLSLEHLPVIFVFNKQDRIEINQFDNPWLLNQGILVSATRRETLKPLVSRLESMVYDLIA
ncbi:GTP-binding protein HflX [Desulfocicer vacuolatum DSM 3385]|uniref:GTPase HflX n=1 Tax=Desulfocicer vacuolatum DSM 3385 TaxID=1121400 RepID=A0A1W2C5Q4_9BACT|nr:GTPase HflX [Desulfocicer vacuolatum]SMC80008.1 GTP-binding protein HflX [Desulfocicer vacuolatum DSM 3385]